MIVTARTLPGWPPPPGDGGHELSTALSPSRVRPEGQPADQMPKGSAVPGDFSSWGLQSPPRDQLEIRPVSVLSPVATTTPALSVGNKRPP